MKLFLIGKADWSPELHPRIPKGRKGAGRFMRVGPGDTVGPKRKKRVKLKGKGLTRLQPRVAEHNDKKVEGGIVTEKGEVDWNKLSEKQRETALAKAIKGIPGFKGLDPEQAIDRMVENIFRVYATIPQSERDRTRHWYRGANDLASKMGKKSGYSTEAMSAVLASLSPNFNWDQNVVQARLLMEIHDEDPEIDAAMIAKVNKIIDKTNKARKAAEKKAGKKSAAGYIPRLEAEPGKLSSIQQGGQAKAALYRALWEAKYPEGLRFQPQMIKDGVIVDDPNEKSVKFSWQSYQFLANAIDIIDNPTMDVIDRALGKGLKVRSFYNNIAFPDDEHHDVTVDVHAGSIVMGAPYAGKEGPQKVIGNTTVDGQLIRIMVAEAYRRAAGVLGYLPDELQSVTWEGWRWSNTQSQNRSKATKDLYPELRAAWASVDEGTMTADEAYAILDKILALKAKEYHRRGVPEYENWRPDV